MDIYKAIKLLQKDIKIRNILKDTSYLSIRNTDKIELSNLSNTYHINNHYKNLLFSLLPKNINILNYTLLDSLPNINTNELILKRLVKNINTHNLTVDIVYGYEIYLIPINIEKLYIKLLRIENSCELRKFLKKMVENKIEYKIDSIEMLGGHFNFSAKDALILDCLITC